MLENFHHLHFISTPTFQHSDSKEQLLLRSLGQGENVVNFLGRSLSENSNILKTLYKVLYIVLYKDIV